jgi:CBS domain containing-hemolysin-like protein
VESHWAALVTLVVSLLFYTLLVLVDAALTQASRHEIRRLAESGNRRATFVNRLQNQRSRWIATAVLLRTLFLLVAGSALIFWATHLQFTLLGQIVTLAIAWLLIAALHLGARLLAQARPLETALRFAWASEAALVLMMPFAFVLSWFSNQLRSSMESDDDSIVIANDGTRLVRPSDSESDQIEESEKEMITSILEMDETVVREVMVPRIDMLALDETSTVDEAISAIIGAGHSRIPVYEESVDQIVGVLYAKDILRLMHSERTEESLRSLLRPAYFVPLSKNVKTLLAEMRKHRVHIAIVVDEYGGTAGLVTIEDILEEIVGEIQDEYDSAEEVLIQRSGEQGYLINARLDIWSLAKLLDIDIEDEDADTAGGLVFGLLGHVAQPGESTEYQGWRFTVLEVDGRRIDRLRADPIAKHQPDEKAPQPNNEARSSGASMKLSPTEE